MTQNKLGNLLNLSLTFVAVSLTANTLHFMTFYVMFKTRTAVFYQVYKFEGVARECLDLIKHVL